MIAVEVKCVKCGKQWFATPGEVKGKKKLTCQSLAGEDCHAG